MTEASEFTARLISASASGYAAAATHRLLEEHPETAARFGPGARAAWQDHLTQRLAELAAALLAAEPELFAAEVAWSVDAFRAREVPDGDLRASLECLAAVLDEELPAASAEQARSYLERGLAALDGPAREAAPPAPGSESDRLGLVYLEAALSGDRRRAMAAILEAVDGGLALPAAFEALLYAQRQVGDLWHGRQLGVAQEHFVTETTRTVMALLTQRAECREPNGKTVMVAPVPGNAHDIGGRVVAAYFEIEGWRTIHLAEPAPADDLALGLDAFEVDLLALSMALTTQLGTTQALVAKVRAQCPSVKILVGGRSLAQSPRLCATIGADACGETAAEAVRLGARLVGLTPRDA